MKEIWEQSKSFRISDKVHMTEVQILQRLKADGVCRWVDNVALMSGEENKNFRIENLHICFYMRRSPIFRYAFAAAVGKRHHSERMSSTGKTSIIEHHRSVQWAEKEYATLYGILEQNQHIVQKELVETSSDTDPMFLDYCRLLKYEEELNLEQAVRWKT